MGMFWDSVKVNKEIAHNKRVNSDRTKLRRFALQLCAPGYAERYNDKG